MWWEAQHLCGYVKSVIPLHSQELPICGAERVEKQHESLSADSDFLPELWEIWLQFLFQQ